MGAAYARHAGVTAGMVSAVSHLAVNLGSVYGLLSDLTLPLLSIFSGKGFSRLVRECLEAEAKGGPAIGEDRRVDISDSWLSFYCVSTNVTKQRQGVHKVGKLWKYVRASMSVVGLLPPINDHGELLVDGAYVSNLPVGIMQNHYGADTVIAVDVEVRCPLSIKSDF